MFIPIILGTGRQGRYSERVAHFILAQAQQFGFTTELIDVRDYVTGSATEAALSPEKSAALQQLLANADGLIIVSPEYNHGYPGELKMLIDEFDKEVQRKPVAFCGVSSGVLGGVRMVEQLRLVTVDLQMANVKTALYFANVETLFVDGVITDPSFIERAKKQFTEIAWWAQTLKVGRERA